MVSFYHSSLSTLLTMIEDAFFLVLGDSFYYMQRIGILANHYYEKRFYISSQKAIHT